MTVTGSQNKSKEGEMKKNGIIFEIHVGYIDVVREHYNLLNNCGRPIPRIVEEAVKHYLDEYQQEFRQEGANQ